MDIFIAIVQILDSTIRLSVPLLLACLAGLYSERAGVFDIGLEGKMLVGAFAGAAAASVFHSALLGLGMAILVSVAFALVHGFASITHRGNQIVSGVAINFIAAGSTIMLGQAWFQQGGRTPALQPGERFEAIVWPGADAVRDVPIIGPIYAELISGHSILVYLAFLMVPFTWWVLFRTRFGLRLRAVGENPAAVDTAGISVAWLRYRALICTGILTGIAGAYLSMVQNGGFVKDMTAGKGYIALAALIFAKWKPVNAMFACLLFGFLDAAGDPPAGLAAADHRQGAGAVHAGAALYPHRHPARRLHRQGDPAARRRRALRQGTLRSWLGARQAPGFGHDHRRRTAECRMICSKRPRPPWPRPMRPIRNSRWVPHLRTEDGRVFTGANIEVASYPEGWCAETTALGHYIMGGGGKIVEIAVLAERMAKCSPCGGCRQRLAEFCRPETKLYLCDNTRRGRDRDHGRHAALRFSRRHLEMKNWLK